MENSKWDFSGVVTQYGVRCSDGLTINQGAFSNADGVVVPIVWGHKYDSPLRVIGRMLLQSFDGGVKGYGQLNDTDGGKTSRELLKHGDIRSMSIGATNIQRSGSLVTSGEIYEVSLVLKGANPGATIEHVMQHSAYAGDVELDDTVIIHDGIEHDYEYSDEGIILHADEGEEKMEGDSQPVNAENEEKDLTVGEVLDTLTDEQREAVDKVLADGEITGDEEKILQSLNEDQMVAVMAIVDDLVDSSEGESEEVTQSALQDEELEDEDYEDEEEEEEEESEDVTQSALQNEGGENLKENAFYNTGDQESMENNQLKHSVNEVIANAASANVTSLAGAIQQSGLVSGETLQHGLANADVLFPQASLEGGVRVYNPDGEAIGKIMNKFSASSKTRIKNIFADLTEDKARARGYITGSQKLTSELIKLYYRETYPTTVYHKDAIDRDDIVDIQENGIDAVNFLKQIEDTKFKAEIVRAALFGDGRDEIVGGKPNPDKIDETAIRPITKDSDLFTIKVNTQTFETAIDDVRMAMPGYQGSARPSLIINPYDLAKISILKDKNNRYLFGSSADANRTPSANDVAAYFGCSEVIEYREMPQGKFLIGNLGDYVFGAAKGGQIATFDQFDIDFNQQKMLMEARLSGAILNPKSFIFVTVATPDVKTDTAKFVTDALKEDPYWTKDEIKRDKHAVNKLANGKEVDTKPEGIGG